MITQQTLTLPFLSPVPSIGFQPAKHLGSTATDPLKARDSTLSGQWQNPLRCPSPSVLTIPPSCLWLQPFSPSSRPSPLLGITSHSLLYHSPPPPPPQPPTHQHIQHASSTFRRPPHRPGSPRGARTHPAAADPPRDDLRRAARLPAGALVDAHGAGPDRPGSRPLRPDGHHRCVRPPPLPPSPLPGQALT